MNHYYIIFRIIVSLYQNKQLTMFTTSKEQKSNIQQLKHENQTLRESLINLLIKEEKLKSRLNNLEKINFDN